MALSVDIRKKVNGFELNTKFETSEGVLALLGASGAGKSMTLRCIAGIEKPDEGRIVLNGRVLFDSDEGINLSPQKRKVGYLFQQYALFPDMTVEQNIRCGLLGRNCRDFSSVDDMIKRMGLSGLEKRFPRQLSGGQQQRVALARILVNEPDILLLDEPFSALDIHLRFRLEREVNSIIRRYGKPAIIVSHDSLETYRLSDNVAVMENGNLMEFGTKDEVFFSPKTRRGAVLTGTDNILRVKVTDEFSLHCEDLSYTIKVNKTHPDTVYVGIKSSDIVICEEDDENVLECRVQGVSENPGSYTIAVVSSRNPCGQSIDINTDKEKNICIGDRIYISFPCEKIHQLRG